MPGKKMIPTMGVVLGLNNTEEKWNSKSKYCSTKHFYNWRSLVIWPIFFKTLEIQNRASLGQDLHWDLAEEMNGRRNVLGFQKYCMFQSRWLLLLGSHYVVFDPATPWTAAGQASPSPGACSNSCPLSQWRHPIISSSVSHFSSCRQSCPASGNFPMSQLFPSGSQSIEASASVSVLPMNIQGWFPLEVTGLISLQSRGLSRVFSSNTVWKHHFFSSQPSLWSSSHIRAWLLEKPWFDYTNLCWQSYVSAFLTHCLGLS